MQVAKLSRAPDGSVPMRASSRVESFVAAREKTREDGDGPMAIAMAAAAVRTTTTAMKRR